MLLSISVQELTAVVFASILTVAIYYAGDSRHRWSFALTLSLAVAAVLTPADLVSTVLTAAALMGAYALGSRHQVALRAAAEHDPRT